MVDEGRCAGAHIVLTGPMGSGKTTVGQLLAGRLDRPFYDSDGQIEAEYGTSSRRLARRHGVEWLHGAEARALRRALSDETPSVVAAAASIGDLENVGGLLGDGIFSVLLHGEAAVLAARAEGGQHRRPVSMEEYMVLSDQRRKLLDEAVDLQVDVTELSPTEVVETILTHCRHGSTPGEESESQTAQ